MVLLNGVWSVVPELRSKILWLAHRSHVIVADQHITLPPEKSLTTALARHTISIEGLCEDANGIGARLTRV